MQVLIDLNQGKLLERGVYPSIGRNQNELWRNSVNVDFRTDRARKSEGYSGEVTTAGGVRAITQAYVAGVRRIYWAESGRIVMLAQDGLGGSIQTQLGTGFTGLGFWGMETWGNFLVATNETQRPQVWKNGAANTMTDLGGLIGTSKDARRFRLMKKHFEHMLGYSGQQVDWSHESDIEQWEPAVENSAGGKFLRDLDSDIITVCPIGKNMAIYSNDRMILQQYVGAPFYFGFEPAIDGIGALSDYSVVSVGNLNYGMGRKGFFRTDGISIDYIDNPMIKDWVFEQFDTLSGRYVVAVHDERNEMVKWWFPCSDNITRGVSYNYKSGSWGQLQQPVTATAPHEVFDAPIIGAGTGMVNTVGFLGGNTLAGEEMYSELETFPLTAGQRENYKLWDLFRVNGSLADVEVRFGFQDELEDDDSVPLTPEWTDWTPLKKENFINRESVYLTISMRALGEGASWKLEGFTVHGEVTGML